MAIMIEQRIKLADGSTLSDILARVPSNIGYNVIKFELELELHDNYPYGYAYLSYERPENENETRAREFLNANLKKREEEQERDMLRRLYKKYGKPE